MEAMDDVTRIATCAFSHVFLNRPPKNMEPFGRLIMVHGGYNELVHGC